MVFGYGPAVSTGMSIASIVIVIVLIASLLLPKKLHQAFNGIVLLLMGILPFMYRMGYTGFDLSSLPIVIYAVTFVIVVAGRELIKDGFREEKKYLKYPSIILGIIIIAFTTIPVLYETGAIGFGLPRYPDLINNVLYVLAGIFLLIGLAAGGKGGV